MILIPVLGGCLIAFLRDSSSKLRGGLFISITFATFIASIAVLLSFYGNGLPVLRDYTWIGEVFAVDRLSLLMVILSTFLFFLCALCGVFSRACGVDKESESSFFALLLLLEATVLGVFSVHTSLMFYVFFEASLIPMFFIIGKWGHGDRISAAFRFLIYTGAASLLFLIGLVYSRVFSLGCLSLFTQMFLLR
ncbi:NADH-Ubiquinone/plastoquinone (complex I), various chains family protein [Anaplasma phagocytophilum str. CR1007]|nr:NADH-Ubiquinone/plastoquinone (complex I), various chains family protein [Anaplasma phagocytophilum str. CR1007]